MSAWSDYKAGLITDAEYEYICRVEYYEDIKSRWADGHDWDDDFDEEEEFEDDDIDEF